MTCPAAALRALRALREEGSAAGFASGAAAAIVLGAPVAGGGRGGAEVGAARARREEGREAGASQAAPLRRSSSGRTSRAAADLEARWGKGGERKGVVGEGVERRQRRSSP